MRSVKAVFVVVAALVGLSAAVPAAAEDEVFTYGVWRNPKNSVHVEIKPCGGGRACGYVVWASAEAQADARKGGSADLVGMQILRDFKLEKGGRWRGRVFVPDLNMTLSGTADFPDAMTMKAKGCLLPNLLCKSQTWKRVDIAAANAPAS
jgi:uncharacterized protein (DUF2147 family)